MCRLGLHFARQGESTLAVEAINTVRGRFEGALGSEVAAWLMLTEGVLHFSEGNRDLSADRLKRSYAVASASGSDTRSICAAWLAHMSLNARRFDDMVSYLREALTKARPEDHHARSRAALVLADAFHYAGRFDLARPWYESARIHATAEGDEAAVSALLHNVAAFRTANVKLADALGTKLPDEAKRASMEAASAASYDRAIGTRSFGELLPHVNEQLLVVAGKYEEALAQLSAIDVRQLSTRVHAVHYIDHATCALETGDIKLAKTLSESAAIALTNYEMDPDDVAYVCCRLAALYRKADGLGSADVYDHQARTAMERHRELQAEICLKLTGLTDSLPEQ
jgi:tetratricopeptide (TPR) repeat protein